MAASAEDISTAVVFSRSHLLDLAIRGGGHHTNGASSSLNGMVIDLSRMRRVVIDPEAKTVTVQGGALWEDVDEAAGEHGLATVGGTVNHTGVGGLTLGGGYGWLAGRHGLTIDNLLCVKMVLADGSIVRASGRENPELFWAVRGAGHCFGVAVEFTYRVHEQENLVWAGQMVFSIDHVEAVVEFANRLVEVSRGESGMLLTLAALPPAYDPTLVATVFYNGPKEDAEAFFAPLLALNPEHNTTSEMPYAKVNSLLNFTVPHGGRKLGKGAIFLTPLRPTFVRALSADLALLYRKIPTARKSILVFEFYNLSKVMEVPQTATAFANRGQHQNVLIVPSWSDDTTHDEDCRLWAIEIARKFAAEKARLMTDEGVTLKMEGVGRYGNYDGRLSIILRRSHLHALMNLYSDVETEPEKIFGVNHQELRRLKTMFDRDNVFNKSRALLPFPAV